MTVDFEEPGRPWGWVPTAGRGSLPFALVHGESLVAAASWAVGEAGASLFDASVGWDQLRATGRPLLIHDPLCPLTPAAFLAEAVALSAERRAVVVGFRPVTDTVKHRDGDALGATLDRDGLRQVASPVVIPAAVLAAMEDPGERGLAGLVEELSQRAPVLWVQAPALAGRVRSPGDLPVLEALSRSAT